MTETGYLASNTPDRPGVAVIIEYPETYPFEPGEAERDWHPASEQEYASYRAYWDTFYDYGEPVAEQIGYFLVDVPDATPAQIREAVSEFLDRDPREVSP